MALFCENHLAVLARLWHEWDGAEETHTCSGACDFVHKGTVLFCRHSGNVHICSDTFACGQSLPGEQGTRFCPLSLTVFRPQLIVCPERLAGDFRVNPASAETLQWDQDHAPESRALQWVARRKVRIRYGPVDFVDVDFWKEVRDRVPAPESSLSEAKQLLDCLWQYICHFPPERVANLLCTLIHDGLAAGAGGGAGAGAFGAPRHTEGGGASGATRHDTSRDLCLLSPCRSVPRGKPDPIFYRQFLSFVRMEAEL
jgi:hypothetical protein